MIASSRVRINGERMLWDYSRNRKTFQGMRHHNTHIHKYIWNVAGTSITALQTREDQ